MYNINEIAMENQNDFYSLLYLYLARSLEKNCGRAGEGAVREAVRRFAQKRGATLMQRHVDAGIKTNLKNMHKFQDCPVDSRARARVRRDTEEVYLAEVYTCPMADIWRRYNGSRYGLWYCEEIHSGMLVGYTEGVGQPNLSERLTCERDNHCSISMFYRMANAPLGQGARSFVTSSEAEVPLGDENQFHVSLGAHATNLHRSMFVVAKERLGKEGVNAIAMGLRDLAVECVAILQEKADHTLRPCDEEFVRAYFPISLCVGEGSQTDCNEADVVLQTNLLDPLKTALGLS